MIIRNLATDMLRLMQKQPREPALVIDDDSGECFLVQRVELPLPLAWRLRRREAGK